MITMLQPVFRNTIEQQGIQAGFAEAGLVVTGKRLEVNEAQIWRGFPGMHQKTPAQMRDYTIALAALEEEVEDYRLAEVPEASMAHEGLETISKNTERAQDPSRVQEAQLPIHRHRSMLLSRFDEKQWKEEQDIANAKREDNKKNKSQARKIKIKSY